MPRLERPLTGDEMNALLTALSEAEDASTVVITTICGPYMALMGPAFDNDAEIRPHEWAIPEEQAMTILEAGSERLAKVTGSGQIAVHLALEWANRGVGTYRPEVSVRG